MKEAAPYIDKNGKTTNGYLGDIYHSEMVVVGEPSADTRLQIQIKILLEVFIELQTV